MLPSASHVSPPADDPAVTDAIHGRYANFFRVGSTAFEFLLDFGQFYLGGGEAQVHTRIVTSPSYAQALARTLQRSLREYEDRHGAIPPAEGVE